MVSAVSRTDLPRSSLFRSVSSFSQPPPPPSDLSPLWAPSPVPVAANDSVAGLAAGSVPGTGGAAATAASAASVPPAPLPDGAFLSSRHPSRLLTNSIPPPPPPPLPPPPPALLVLLPPVPFPDAFGCPCPPASAPAPPSRLAREPSPASAFLMAAAAADAAFVDGERTVLRFVRRSTARRHSAAARRGGG